MFFSATYDEEVMEFAEAIVSNPVIIRLKREEESLDNIKQYYVQCKDKEEKYQAISNIYGVITIGQAMIFCRVRIFFYHIVSERKKGFCKAVLASILNQNFIFSFPKYYGFFNTINPQRVIINKLTCTNRIVFFPFTKNE